MPLLLLGIVTIAFCISRLIPANPLASIVGERQLNNEKIVNAAKTRWGLNGSIPEQYFVYVKNLVKGDLGTSFRTRQPVTHDLFNRLPATLELAGGALLVGGVGGVALGAYAASKKDKPADHLSRLFSLLGSSLPVFWIGLVFLFVLYARLGWFPGPGRLPPRTKPPDHVTGFYTFDSLLDGNFTLFRQCLWRLVLPCFVLGWAYMGSLSRLVRAAMLDEINSDYVRTARAKGLPERLVMRRHVLRNAWLPTLTILGFSFAQLLTASVLTETIFQWNGIGSYAVQAANTLDFPAVNGVSLFAGLAFLLANLATDVLYAVADPKIRLA
ncbi:MAG: peptide/nickel transport system permease protein [Ilumatobacteraceae bacterium]|jgi:peptide/nickel transport system permease protein